MTKDQEERLVAAWEMLASGLGALNEIARTAVGKQWPEAKPVREAVISRLPSAEDKIKTQTGNTDIPIGEWLSELEDEQEIGPREKMFLDSKKEKK